ncbi:hypothetical protein BH09MYX1_BH09MYX1_44420 [soil metagenome]
MGHAKSQGAPASVSLKLPDRLVQIAVGLTAASAYAATLGWSGVSLRWTLPSVAIASGLWAFEARRGERGKAWIGAACVAGGGGLGLALGGLHLFFALLAAGVGTLVAWSLVSGLRRATLVEGALDRLERLSLRSAMCLAAAGAVAVAAPSVLAVALGVSAWIFGGGLLAWSLVRDRKRGVFFRALYAGDVATHRISSDDGARGLAHLPPVLSGTITDAVVVEGEARASTYRIGTARHAVARCQRDSRDALGVLERRGSVLVATFGAMLGVSPLAVIAHLHFAVAPHAIFAAAPAATTVAPTCAEARPFFHESLPVAVHGVGRAVLLTHDQDPTIHLGNGVLLLVPESGGPAPLEMRGAALAWATRVPCRDKLSLDVASPNYRPMKLAAAITLDGLVARDDVEREIRETVAEMFQRDGRSVRATHVDFGSEDKAFGYGVRYALRHLSGVKSVTLDVNGHEGDEPMGPRDFPVLESFDLTLE